MIPDSTLIEKEVLRALEEDIGSGDVTAELLKRNLNIKAHIISREPMLLCGIPWVDGVFKQVDPEILIEWNYKEGSWLNEPAVLCELKGAARSILTGERTALNFLQTLSGTATKTYFYVQKIKSFPAQLLDTRKTIPGLRVAQKYAVSVAGGVNHRFGLYDAYLIKENHIKACGSIREAVQLAREKNNGLFVEVEVETLEQLKEAILAKPDRILLDNFSLSSLKEAVNMNRALNGPKLEASGGISHQTISEIAATGVDFISMGTITKSVEAIDLSLLVEEVNYEFD